MYCHNYLTRPFTPHAAFHPAHEENATDPWIKQWLSHLAEASNTVNVPPEATMIISPLIPENWKSFLIEHPEKSLVQFLLDGIIQGFRIGYCNPSLH